MQLRIRQAGSLFGGPYAALEGGLRPKNLIRVALGRIATPAHLTFPQGPDVALRTMIPRNPARGISQTLGGDAVPSGQGNWSASAPHRRDRGGPSAPSQPIPPRGWGCFSEW